MSGFAFFEQPAYLPSLWATALVVATVGITSLVNRLVRNSRRVAVPRQLFIVSLALAAIVLLIHLISIGLDKADKLSSIISMFLAIATLGVASWISRSVEEKDEDEHEPTR
ncbi:hypothetical protein [Jidongwangia harbinensis]|uniref:hypothetical protein n=1 Tax=Jidongwangia harbinensis TaxID=2878561 RepID=UPI001CD99231|nr:hypothetical protein [Jidongwangia harbinensis]MCA2217151.1 hypothetical protein [Jidongwangia harbinensis]